jgi:transcriptional regulator with XRE-family HTH domain
VSLKSLRIAAGLSQHELGQRLAKAIPSGAGSPEYFQPRISSYESGRNNMPLSVALAITKILNQALKKAGSKQTATIEALASPTKKPRA